MKIAAGSVLALGCLGLAVAQVGTQITGYRGGFRWYKLGQTSSVVTRSLAGAHFIQVDLNFRNPVHLRPDAHGNQWFTFLIADQGPDWKWFQTQAAVVPSVNGFIKAGPVSVSVPVAGIPASVLNNPIQHLSFGPATSGLPTPAAFTIVRIHGK